MIDCEEDGQSVREGLPRMSRCLWLLAVVLLIAHAGMSRVALAQEALATPQARYIEELKQRNDDYGPGCNGIGISVPIAVDMPAAISSRWAAGHSACIPGMRLVATCIGEVVAEDRVVGCTLRVADGQAAETIGCERLTLLTASTRFAPDPTLSDALAEGSEGGSGSCSEPRDLTPDTAIAAAFLAPAMESSGDLALLIDLDGSEVPAFLIPSGQLDVSPPADS
jgi:hypothetical protein